MEIDFYTGFYKKTNSTKRPDNTATVHTYTGYLREPCSVLNPSVSIKDNLSSGHPPLVTMYAYIPRFFRYYFVKDWQWDNGVWTVNLTVDVLATWKTHIGEETEYILRTDSTTDFNGEITDVIYPATTDISTSTTEYASPFAPATISAGVYIVGIISGETTNSIGAVTYYILTSAEFGALKHKLFSDDGLYTMGIVDAQGNLLIQDMSEEMFKAMYNPYQYIASCKWFPINLSDIPNTAKEAVTTIPIGWWPYTLNGYRVRYPMVNITESGIAVPSHPQASARGQYLNYAPYTRRSLCSRFGTVPLDGAFFQDGDTIQIRYNVDFITGQCRAVIERVRNNAINFILEKNFVLATDIQLAQIGVDYLGTAVTAISSVANVAQQTMNFQFGNAIASAANGIYNTLQAQMPQLMTSGSNGSILSANIATKMITMFYKIVDEDIEHRGRPLCELRRIDTLSGYILCAEGDLDLNCYDDERKAISRYLTTGFFWE